jgi:hypothetical protein
MIKSKNLFSELLANFILPYCPTSQENTDLVLYILVSFEAVLSVGPAVCEYTYTT